MQSSDCQLLRSSIFVLLQSLDSLGCLCLDSTMSPCVQKIIFLIVLGFIETLGSETILVDQKDYSDSYAFADSEYDWTTSHGGHQAQLNGGLATPYTEGWFYLPGQGWLWTTRTVYPYFFDYSSRGWIYFQSGNNIPKFYHFDSDKWITVTGKETPEKATGEKADDSTQSKAVVESEEYKPEALKTVRSAANLKMIWVPAGSFEMGSQTSEKGRKSNREDLHPVSFSDGFYLGKYEVTQAEYEAVMSENEYGLSPNPSGFQDSGTHPVEKVSWEDTQIFFEILNASEKAIGALKVGWEYQLPTEAEWEYACRAGSKTRYSWGDEVLMYDANWNHLQDAQKTEAVGSYYANSWGFYDMHGNVWEWVADWYDAAYPTSLVIDPTGPVSGKYRVLRGGSWNSPGNYLRSAMRFYNTPRATGDNMGFRVALRKTRQSSKSTSLTQ